MKFGRSSGDNRHLLFVVSNIQDYLLTPRLIRYFEFSRTNKIPRELIILRTLVLEAIQTYHNQLTMFSMWHEALENYDRSGSNNIDDLIYFLYKAYT